MDTREVKFNESVWKVVGRYAGDTSAGYISENTRYLITFRSGDEEFTIPSEKTLDQLSFDELIDLAREAARQ